MAAPEGNKYNERWTLEVANDFFDRILKYIKQNKNCRSLSEACVELNEYEEVINYILRKYPEQDFKPIKVAKDIVKNRLASQGLDGEANPTMAIFLLKNNHNMTDKQQTDVTTNGKEINTAPIIKFVDSNEDE